VPQPEPKDRILVEQQPVSPRQNVDSGAQQPSPSGTAPIPLTKETNSTAEPSLDHVYVDQPEISTKTCDSASDKASSVTTLVSSPVSPTQPMATPMNEGGVDGGKITTKSTNELSHADISSKKTTKDAEITVAEIFPPKVCNTGPNLSFLAL
jgi:hypothetical protein